MKGFLSKWVDKLKIMIDIPVISFSKEVRKILCPG
jgi:hypothetical protein